MSGAYLVYYLREESQICCMDTSLDADVSHAIFRSLWSWIMTLLSRIIMSGAYLLYYLMWGIPNLVYWFLLRWRSGAHYFRSLWPWHWLMASFLGFSCLEHISYITANFSQMCLMLDHFLWGAFVTLLWHFLFKHKMRHLMVSKKKNPLFVWGWDRKIRPSGSLFAITRQGLWCQTVILGTDFSIPPSLS